MTRCAGTLCFTYGTHIICVHARARWKYFFETLDVGTHCTGKTSRPLYNVIVLNFRQKYRGGAVQTLTETSDFSAVPAYCLNFKTIEQSVKRSRRVYDLDARNV